MVWDEYCQWKVFLLSRVTGTWHTTSFYQLSSTTIFWTHTHIYILYILYYAVWTSITGVSKSLGSVGVTIIKAQMVLHLLRFWGYIQNELFFEPNWHILVGSFGLLSLQEVQVCLVRRHNHWLCWPYIIWFHMSRRYFYCLW